LFHREARGRELAEELDAHLQMEIDANIERGMRPDDARHAARRGFGSPARLRESSHNAWSFRWLESILQDLRYGFRQFRKAPGLTLAVVASLAIGLGANTAIFSLIDAALLRPLPVADPEGLVHLEWRNDGVPDGASMNCGSMSGARNDEASRSAMGGDRLQLPCVSQLTFRAFAERQTAFAGIVGTGNPADVAVSAAAGTPAEQLRFLHVSANFFDELGVRLVAGRPFLEEEDRPDADAVVIVSHRFWSGSLGRDPAAVGGVIRINDEPARVVGVAPAGFFGITPGEWIDVYRPLGSEGFSQIPEFGALFWGVDTVECRPHGPSDGTWRVNSSG
jgi:hypothetical protein